MPGTRQAAAIGGLILGAGVFAASYGMNHPVGQAIPDKKEQARMEGAQADAVKSGSNPKDAVENVSLKKKGGDKGLKMVGAENSS